MFARLKRYLLRLFFLRDRAADARDLGLEVFYTNSEAALESLRALVIGPPSPKRIVLIHGTSGVGKSSLLRMFRLFCRRQANVFAALAEGRGALELLRRLAEELEATHLRLSGFRDKLRTLEKIQTKLSDEEADRQKKALLKMGSQVASTAAAILPATAAAAPILGSDAFVNWLSSMFSKRDVDLYLRPDEVLTQAFIDDMQGAQDKRVALLIDTYEQATAINDWVGDFACRLPGHVALVIAGRVTPASSASLSWNRVWPGWITQMLPVELQPLEDADLRLLIQRYFRTIRGQDPDAEQVTKILRFACGLPLIVTTTVNFWAAHVGRFDFDEERADVVQHLVNDVIMKDSPEALRALLEAAAALRTFNKESLAALTDAATANAGYRDIENAPYVRGGSKGLALHEKIRDVINEYVEFNTPERATDLHTRAATYYEERLKRAPEQRQRLVAEVVYHRYHASRAEGRRALRDLLDAAYARRQLSFCREVINDVRAYADDDETLDWLAFYDALLEVYADGEPAKPVEMLERLLEKPHLERDLHASALEYLAAMIWYYKLREGSDVKRAERLYEVALDLRRAEPPDLPGQARLLIWLGVLRQRTQGKGEPLFREGMEIAQTLGLQAMTAFAQRELSIALRMQGRFADALPLIDASAQTFEALGLDSDAAHSVLNQGMLLACTGRLTDAEKRFRKCTELFDRSGTVRPAERAWPLHGLADLELRRGNSAAARKLFEDAGKQWKDDTFGTAVFEGALATVDLAEKHFDLALQHAERAIEISAGSDDAYGRAWSLKTRGRALLGLGRLQEARAAIDEALEGMQQYGATHTYALILAETNDPRAEPFAKERGYEDILAIIATGPA